MTRVALLLPGCTTLLLPGCPDLLVPTQLILARTPCVSCPHLLSPGQLAVDLLNLACSLLLLRLIVVEDARPVLSPGVATLAVAGGWVHLVKECV